MRIDAEAGVYGRTSKKFRGLVLRALMYSFSLMLVLGFEMKASAQDLIPAGTLLQCTLSEPNFSSATASVGDPVVCYLKSLQQFGHIVLPRGSYLQGHLAAEKDPGHFWGKGSLKLEFDRIGLPNADIPVPSKLVAASGGYKSNREGELMGKGHATRDIVEWMLPPLWPWKMISLPARGPRPKLKGEVLLTLRLMDDVVLPKMADARSAPTPDWRRFGESNEQLQNRPDSYNSTPQSSISVGQQVTPDTGPLPKQRTTHLALRSSQDYAAIPPPVCSYDYYGHYPYACVPYGSYWSQGLVGGVFIGAGPSYGRGYSSGRGYYGGVGYRGGYPAGSYRSGGVSVGYRGGGHR